MTASVTSTSERAALFAAIEAGRLTEGQRQVLAQLVSDIGEFQHSTYQEDAGCGLAAFGVISERYGELMAAWLGVAGQQHTDTTAGVR